MDSAARHVRCAVRAYRRLSPAAEVVAALEESSHEAFCRCVDEDPLLRRWPPPSSYVRAVCSALLDQQASDAVAAKLAHALTAGNDDDDQGQHATFELAENVRPVTLRLFKRSNEVGLRLWPAAELFAAWVAAEPARWRCYGSVVELGAGLGLAGLAVARVSGRTKVLLTDGDPTVVRNLQYVAEVNEASTVALFDWNDRPLPRCDAVIAADAVYDPLAVRALALALRDSNAPDLFLANEVRNDDTWAAAEDALRSAGLELAADETPGAVVAIESSSSAHDEGPRLLSKRAWERHKRLALEGRLRLLRYRRRRRNTSES